MSYILDALQKAAEQRHTLVPEVRRLLPPTPVPIDRTSRHLTLAAALAGAVALMGVVWLWAPSPESPRPMATVSPGAVDRVPAPVDVTRRDEPPPSSPAMRPQPPSPPLPSVQATSPPQPPPVLAAKPPVVAPKSGRPTPPGPEPRPFEHPLPPPTFMPPAAAPPTSAAPSRGDAGSLKLEVIVYSDERPKRMVFINGRKYVEGDVVRDGARIEEIQSDVVILNEDGRRVTLRP